MGDVAFARACLGRVFFLCRNCTTRTFASQHNAASRGLGRAGSLVGRAFQGLSFAPRSPHMGGLFGYGGTK